MSDSRPLVLTLALAAALLLAGCRKSNELTGAGCRQDSDCGEPAAAYRCDTQNGACYCRTNSACASTQFCNTNGFCQDKAGCEKNDDCLDPSLFCDTSSGTCLSYGRCTIDLHCAVGQVCDSARTTCVDGCRGNGDCPGTSCRCGEGPCGCDGGTQAERAGCEIGVCDDSFCSDKTFCRFGEQCGVVPDAGVPHAQCFSDYDPDRRPYCSNCTGGGGIQTCGSGPNYCLIDTANPGNYFCGVDCSDQQPCPRGYGCSDVIVVFTQWQCTRTNPSCPGNPALPCTDDAQCKRGGTCLKAAGQPSGFCAGACNIDEGDSIGYCSCQVDSDCAQESCNAGECSISRRPCIDSDDCRPIRCVDYQGAGGCLIGQNCAPENGLSCLDIQ